MIYNEIIIKNAQVKINNKKYYCDKIVLEEITHEIEISEKKTIAGLKEWNCTITNISLSEAILLARSSELCIENNFAGKCVVKSYCYKTKELKVVGSGELRRIK